MDEIIVNNLPENTSPTAADKLMLIRTADGKLTIVSVGDLSEVGGGGLTPALKDALLQLAAKVVYIDADGQDYYNDLFDALYPLSSIDAVFTQGANVVYDTDSLDSLKSMLVVTATYDNGDTETVASTDYTLSGTLTVGTSTITATYRGKTDTFTVTVTQGVAYIHDWDFTQSMVDSVGNITAVLDSNSSYTAPTRDSSGIHFTDGGGCLDLGEVYARDITIEVECSDINFSSTAGHTRFLMFGNSTNTGNGLFVFRINGTQGWTAYINTWGSALSGYTTLGAFNGNDTTTFKFKIASDGTTTIYKDNVLLGTLSLTAPAPDSTNSHFYLGSKGAKTAGGNFYTITVRKVRIKSGVN